MEYQFREGLGVLSLQRAHNLPHSSYRPAWVFAHLVSRPCLISPAKGAAPLGKNNASRPSASVSSPSPTLGVPSPNDRRCSWRPFIRVGTNWMGTTTRVRTGARRTPWLSASRTSFWESGNTSQNDRVKSNRCVSDRAEVRVGSRHVAGFIRHDSKIDLLALAHRSPQYLLTTPTTTP